MNRKNIYLFISLFLLTTSIFFPPLKVGSYTLYLTTIFSFTVLLFPFFYGFKVNKFFFITLLLGINVFFSTTYSFSFGLSSYNIANYVEAVKYLQFIPYLMLLSLIDRAENKVFNIVIGVVISLFILVYFIQFFNLLNLKEFFLKLYLNNDSSHFEKAFTGWRLTLTGSDPNVGAGIAIFLIIYCLDSFLNTRKNLYFFLVIVLFMSILSTQSRTALIASIVSMLVVLLLSKISYLNKIITCSAFSFLFLSVLYFIDIDYVVAGFDLLLTGDNESANIRIDNLNQGLLLFYDSPYFGYGPAKNELSSVIDSEYVLILQRYGVVGVFIFSYFILSLLYYGYKARKCSSGRILLSYTIFTLFFMTTNNAYSGYQLMSISIFLILWVYSDLRLNNKIMSAG